MKSKDQYPIVHITDFQTGSDAKRSIICQPFSGANSITKPHAHDFFIFFLFEKGSGTHSINFTDHEVRPRQIHLLFPGQVHQWTLGADTLGQKLIITKHLFEKFVATLQFSIARYNRYPVIDLDPETYQKIATEFSLIQKELAAKPVFLEVISLRTSLIATLANRLVEQKTDDTDLLRGNSVLLKFHLLIEQHYREQKSVSFYATQLNVTPNYLTILCKKNFQVSAMSLIQQKVILEAKRLMHASELSIKEIAFELGFHEIAYFSYFFKSKTGLSPRQYRSRIV